MEDCLKIYKMNPRELTEYIWHNQKDRKYTLIDLTNMNSNELLNVALEINNK